MLLLWSCVTEEEEEKYPPIGNATLITGTSNFDGSGHVTIQDGQDVTLVPGAQGGFHVWLSIRIKDASGKLYLDREARRTSDQKLILRGQQQLIEVPNKSSTNDEWYQIPDPLPAFMCPSPIGIQVFDDQITFKVILRNEDEEIIAEDEVTLMPRCPEKEHRDFCMSICQG